jgi:hypothetical protein
MAVPLVRWQRVLAPRHHRSAAPAHLAHPLGAICLTMPQTAATATAKVPLGSGPGLCRKRGRAAAAGQAGRLARLQAAAPGRAAQPCAPQAVRTEIRAGIKCPARPARHSLRLLPLAKRTAPTRKRIMTGHSRIRMALVNHAAVPATAQRPWLVCKRSGAHMRSWRRSCATAKPVVITSATTRVAFIRRQCWPTSLLSCKRMPKPA